KPHVRLWGPARSILPSMSRAPHRPELWEVPGDAQPPPTGQMPATFLQLSLLQLAYAGCRWELPESRSGASCLLPSEGLKAELLATNTRLGHKAPFLVGEDRHAFLVFRVLRRSCRSRHRASRSGGRELPLLEVRQRRHRLEENDLRVGLTANLGADGPLGEARLPDGLALLEDDSRAGVTANPDGSLYNCREHRISDRVVEEASQPRICLLEDRDGRLGLLY